MGIIIIPKDQPS